VVWVPYTVRPEIRNRDQVREALAKEYPPFLREAGIGGRVVVWLFVDERGYPQKRRVGESSGNGELDRAAMRVASMIRFTPALNEGRKVPVWISMPITFSVRR
jgi:protein TonB